MTSEATVPLQTSDGRNVGQFTLTCLRGREKWRNLDALIDFQERADEVFPAAPVQLLEELSYAYTIGGLGERRVERLEPEDLFSSATNAAEGRLDANRATGTLTVQVFFSDGVVGSCDVEVRSRKLNYQTEYRSMLQRIAREAAELVQAAFAPSSLPAFRPDSMSDPQTTYQRFAFVKALLESESMKDAMHQIERRPHSEHVAMERLINPARSTRCTAALAKQLTGSRPRQPVFRPTAGLNTLPLLIRELINETTFDTVPNRFVKYVLNRWRSIASDVEQALDGNSPSERRGRREAQLVSEELERVLLAPALRDSGRLVAFPHSNQVLQGRMGYRDILEAFLLAESAATINWDDGNRLFRAGQRNVAELYEYWVFLELVRIVETLPGFTVDKRSLVQKTRAGLSLELSRNGRAVVTAFGHRRGTPVEIKVWFNKSFPGSATSADASWTVPMRPDCSIQVAPKSRTLDADTWVHFDAKYRLHELSDALDDVTEESELQVTYGDQRPISGDLAKMHAYRDAIRRTAGAYVLYPGREGSSAVRHAEYHEVLPGLGAFTLRPTDDGESSRSSSAALAEFLEDVIDHVAAQGTAAERSRYWNSQSYNRSRPTRLEHSQRLSKPPHDTTVLLGFVRSEAHLEWVMSSGLYNIRADAQRAGSVGIDAPELSPDFVLLYDDVADATVLVRATGVVLVQTAADLVAAGYPHPRGDRYLCLVVETDFPEMLEAGATARSLARKGRDANDVGSPTLVTWAELAAPHDVV